MMKKVSRPRKQQTARKATTTRRAAGSAGRPLRSTFIGQSSARIRSAPSQTAVASDKSGHRIRVAGHEYIGAVSVPTGGDVANTIYVNRPNMAGPLNTRLRQFAEIFERWRPHKYEYKFIPSLPTTTPGTLVFAHDPDPATLWVSAATGNIARMRAMLGSKMQQSYLPAVSSLPSSRDYTSLWTYDPSPAAVQESDRLDLAGTFLIGCAAPTGLAAGSVLGTLELHYDIEFYVPKLASSVSTRASSHKFTGAAATAINAGIAAGTQGIIDAVMSKLKAQAPTISTDQFGGAVEAILNYKPLTWVAPSMATAAEGKDEKKPNVVPYTPDFASGGWRAGIYYIEIIYAVNNTTDVPNITGITHWDANCSYVSGDLVGPRYYTNWYGPDGIVYPKAVGLTTEFGAGEKKQYSFSDYAYTLPVYQAMFVNIYVATSPVLTSWTGLTTEPVVTAKTSRMEPARLPSRVHLEPDEEDDDDLASLSPPRQMRLRSSLDRPALRAGAVLADHFRK